MYPEDYISYQGKYSDIDGTMLDGGGYSVMDRNRGAKIGTVKRIFPRLQNYPYGESLETDLGKPAAVSGFSTLLSSPELYFPRFDLDI